MGIFANQEYFERVSQLPQADDVNLHAILPQSPASDLQLQHTIGLKSATQISIDDQLNPKPSNLATTNLNRPSILKKKRKIALIIKIVVTLLVGAMIIQTFNMSAVFENVFPNHWRSGGQHGRQLNPLERAYISLCLFFSVLLFAWMAHSVWTNNLPSLYINLVLNVIQLVAFIALPVIYFNPEVNYRKCLGKFDCMRYTLPILNYIITDVFLILAFALFVIKKSNHSSRKTRFSLV